ncbi:fungal-specific transcription factor domain-containing protein [Lophiotrema nucula]|uniref:Fungal-specific transcription factor domain-containing protein n=1 Tax=Lophiotrema nucula TaxID=690887 RepID=A0A6A5YE26_9PLEO|nr:fungal-specific transcription factor domain-containing protein [Lophiotrema nucula]
MGIAHKIYQLNNQRMLKRTISAIPGGDLSNVQTSRHDRMQRRPIASVIGYSLPTTEVMATLIEEYFDSVHWFSLVIFEPRFRSKFESVRDGLAFPSQKSFLLLLSSILGMAAWYKSHKDSPDGDHSGEDLQHWASALVQGAGSQLVDLMDDSSIASVQTCILLGSYYVYHGKPNLSFALLGATTKTAQALGLHRQTSSGTAESIEERKRVWWTIYTWDRFASVTYGRPLGINDKDCNVEMPLDMAECRQFRAGTVVGTDNSICYSTYQRELNRIYIIASPVIEMIYGIRTVGSSKEIAGLQYTRHIMKVTEKLWHWRNSLPSHLVLDLTQDYALDLSAPAKVHRLQALSLQLTFDNLLIITQRPFLAQQVDHLFKNPHGDAHSSATHSPIDVLDGTHPSPVQAPSASGSNTNLQLSTTEQWWHAALRTSKVTEMPHLAQLATETHLVAFLAINLFNSAIVMVVLALSDPLSDRAQEVKRTITRIFRLQEVLGKRTTLSVQSNVVLKDVIHMLLQREAEAILAPVTASQVPTTEHTQPRSIPSDQHLMSVEDTLRLPLQFPFEHISGLSQSRVDNSADRFQRLNESLASVQRAFPFGIDGVQASNVTGANWDPSAGPDQVSGTNTQPWAETAFSDQNIEGYSLEQPYDESGVDLSNNGLYWFWDSIWNDTRP